MFKILVILVEFDCKVSNILKNVDTFFDLGTIIGISVGGIVGLVFTIFSIVMLRIKMQAKREKIISEESKR